jgi:dTDP-4-amino-4,6-dideoxygalactose transaminase
MKTTDTPIPFNIPCRCGTELDYIAEAIGKAKLSGDGTFTKKCHQWLERSFGIKKALLTTSCTHALDMAAILSGVGPGDEVILPSYTFVSTANAFVLRGAIPVFVDIRPDTMNIDENLIKPAITAKTKAIVVVHYAGVACEMDFIKNIAKTHNLVLIEDAAQAVMSKYKNAFLSSIGDIGCYSFHETKNYTCGEGGALCLNDSSYIERAEIIREKGTNRTKFFRGEIDKYTWCDIGSSYLPSELNAAYLYAQLEHARQINDARLKIYDFYAVNLGPLQQAGLLELPFVPENCVHNAHMFYVKLKDIDERTRFVECLKKRAIMTVFHYVPLHSSPAGRRYGRFHGEDKFTTRESERIVRLPLWYGMEEQPATVVRAVYEFFGKRF